MCLRVFDAELDELLEDVRAARGVTRRGRTSTSALLPWISATPSTRRFGGEGHRPSGPGQEGACVKVFNGRRRADGGGMRSVAARAAARRPRVGVSLG